MGVDASIFDFLLFCIFYLNISHCEMLARPGQARRPKAGGENIALSRRFLRPDFEGNREKRTTIYKIFAFAASFLTT